MRDGAAAAAHPCEGSAESQSHRPGWQFHLWVHFPKNRKLGLKDSSTGLAVYSQLPKGEVMRRVRACVRACVRDMHTVENHSALITEEILARALCRVNLEDTTLHEPSSTDCALQGLGSGQWPRGGMGSELDWGQGAGGDEELREMEVMMSDKRPNVTDATELRT